MDEARLQNVVGGLRRAVSAAGAGGLTDSELLGRWVARRDEGAFEALLWRHAAAVLGVCRRVVGDTHAAEDAAQATFLALARKAGSIGRRQAVAGWLYAVACRAALQEKARMARRPAPVPHGLEALAGRPAEDPVWRDLRPILDQEVGRLPAKYRAAFVLCHVEGYTNEEAARELGCPVGTVLSRLARARRRLRDRLIRRGVTLAAGSFVLALGGEAAAVPGELVRGAVRAAALSAAGKSLAGSVSVEAAALAQGVVRAMLLTKVKMGVAVVVAASLVGGGGGVLTYHAMGTEPGAAPKEAVARAQDDRGAPEDVETLRRQLEQKEREIRELRDRLKAQEQELRAALDELRDRMKAQQGELRAALDQARAQAEMARANELRARKDIEGASQARRVAELRARKDFEAASQAHRDAELRARKQAEDELQAHRDAELRARKQAEDELQARRAAELSARKRAEDELQARRAAEDAAAEGARASRAEEARDEMELLEAQLLARRAQLEAAQLSLEAAQKWMQTRPDAKTGIEVAALAGQVRVKEAELKESAIRLAQARRRLARLQGGAEAPQEPHGPQVGQRTAELERKLEVLKKELESLRREIQQQRQDRP
jgi:RNA polymerase sigma factor (sigma-70 family)